MSEEQGAQGAEGSGIQDQNQNIKAEFNRKIENLSKANESLATQNDALSQKLDAIMGQLESNNQQSAINSNAQESIEDLRYTDPDKYIELKMAEVDKKVDAKLQQQNDLNTQKQQVLTQLSSDYPEINDPNSELYKKAIEIGTRYNKDFVATPEGIQLAVREAAAQLGVIPSNLRKKQVEGEGEQDMSEFIGGGSSGSNNSKGKKQGKQELDQKTVVTAELMGLDTNDPKVIERLKKRASRKNWNRWE